MPNYAIQQVFVLDTCIFSENLKKVNVNTQKISPRKKSQTYLREVHMMTPTTYSGHYSCDHGTAPSSSPSMEAEQSGGSSKVCTTTGNQ